MTHLPSGPLERAPRTDALQIASVPTSHVYVRHIADPDPTRGADVARWPDPDPDDPSRTTTARWWPPVMLDPAWIRDHPDFDVLHIQFGFDALSEQRLQAVIDAAHANGQRVVYTVHDLRNPHQRDRRTHDELLDVLIPQADALITLTPGSAAEISRRWDRTATVIPHPHVVDLDTMVATRRRPRPRDEKRVTVGLHVKSLRACMDPLAVLPALLRAVDHVPGAVLQVNGHRDVLDPTGERYDARLVAALDAARDRIDLRIHDFLDDAALWKYLSGLDVSVLPYRWGTHSGWLEACRDLGTAVVAPTCGYYADQGPVHSYVMDDDHLDEDSLVAAVVAACQSRPASTVSVPERIAQRRAVARAHADLYRSVMC